MLLLLLIVLYYLFKDKSFDNWSLWTFEVLSTFFVCSFLKKKILTTPKKRWRSYPINNVVWIMWCADGQLKTFFVHTKCQSWYLFYKVWTLHIICNDMSKIKFKHKGTSYWWCIFFVWNVKMHKGKRDSIAYSCTQ